MQSGSGSVALCVWAWTSIGLGEQGLVWREMMELAGWHGTSVGWCAGRVTAASYGVGMRVGSMGDGQVVDETLNSGVLI